MEITLETDYFTLTKVADGVYAAIAKPGQGAWSNAGFVDLGDELLVFDSFSTPSAAQELRTQAEKLTGKSTKYLVNSHYHGDHVFGNQAFEDVTIISTTLTRTYCQEQHVLLDVEKEQEEMKQYLCDLQKQIESTTDFTLKNSLSLQYEEMNKVLESISYLNIVLPSVLFENHLTIHGSERSVEIHCLGGGHTASDSILYVPKEKIIFTGDIVTENLHVPIYNPEAFLSMLQVIDQMEMNTVIPGHGEIGTKTLCVPIIQYISFLIEKAKEAHEKNLSLQDLISKLEIPDEYTRWNGIHGIYRNLTTVYDFYI